MAGDESIVPKVVWAGGGLAIVSGIVVMGAWFVAPGNLNPNAALPWWAWAILVLGALAMKGGVQVSSAMVACVLRVSGAGASLLGLGLAVVVALSSFLDRREADWYTLGPPLAVLGFLIALGGNGLLALEALSEVRAGLSSDEPKRKRRRRKRPTSAD